ncbi:unnamed protein product [Nezara viridula]|uniref:Uncharacterized protein n=1 Tax=Nezara viridula TaxID=85310 RepID=A0A9P0ECF2_NEZVI|nr:unnamed protein product [Nezara viridula]
MIVIIFWKFQFLDPNNNIPSLRADLAEKIYSKLTEFSYCTFSNMVILGRKHCRNIRQKKSLDGF